MITMAYAFEFASRQHFLNDSLNIIKVDSIISKKKAEGIKLILISKFGQSAKENRHILINNNLCNGKEKNINYKLITHLQILSLIHYEKALITLIEY